MKTSLRFLIVLLVTISVEKGLEVLFKPKNKLSPTEKLQELLRTKRELAPINMHDQECEEEGVVEEGDNLKSYFLCENTGKDPGLLYKEHKCEKNEFFNASISDCSQLPGGGHIDCVTHNACPEEFTGVTQFPNSTMQRNYVICLENIVIVAECEELWFFSNETNNCQREHFKRKTVLIESNCEEIKEIQCETADVIKVTSENNAETCSNCYYFCVEAENNTFALTIYCYGNVTTEEGSYEDISTEVSTPFTQLEETTEGYSENITGSAKTTSKDHTVAFTTFSGDLKEKTIATESSTASISSKKSTELTETSTKRELATESTSVTEVDEITPLFMIPDTTTEQQLFKESTIEPKNTSGESSTASISLGKSTEITETSIQRELTTENSTSFIKTHKSSFSEDKTETTTFPVEKTSFSTSENFESTTQIFTKPTENEFNEMRRTKLDEENPVTSPIIILPIPIPIPEITTEQQLVEKPATETENVEFTSAKPPAEATTTTTLPELSTTINISFSETTQSIFPTFATKERSTSVSIFHQETTKKEIIIEHTAISTISPEKTTLTEIGNFTTIEPASSESQTTTPPKFQDTTFPSADNITETTTIKSIASSPITSAIPQTTETSANTNSKEIPVSTKKPKLSRHQHCIDKGPPCTSSGYFRLNQSCTQHYECYFSKFCNKLVSSRIYNCPKCLKFNAAKMCCDLPENVPECANLFHETPHSFVKPKNKKKDNCTGPGTFFAPDDCEKYYSCSQNKSNKSINLVVKKCPKGSRFNRKTLKCEKGLQCRRSLPKCKNGVDYYISDKFDCNKFYHCLGKMFVPLTCPAGTIFDGKKCDTKSTTYLCDWEALKKKLHKHKKL